MRARNRCLKEIIDILEIDSKNQEIIKNDFFTIRYLYFDAGKGLTTQHENAMAAVQVIEGRITFVHGKDENACSMQGGTTLEFDARETYSIIAHENSKILITIVPIK